MNPATKDQITSIVRTLLKVGGGVLIANGVPAVIANGITQSPDVVSLVSGLALAGVGSLWSWVTHAAK